MAQKTDQAPNSEDSDDLPNGLFGNGGPFAEILRAIDPAKMFKQNLELTQSLFAIAMGKSEIAPDPRDARFRDDAWKNNPFYHRLSQAYLAMTEAVEQMIPDNLSPDNTARA